MAWGIVVGILFAIYILLGISQATVQSERDKEQAAFQTEVRDFMRKNS
jgi:hypothetical protein